MVGIITNYELRITNYESTSPNPSEGGGFNILVYKNLEQTYNYVLKI